SASELARSAAKATPAHAFHKDHSFRAYEAYQQQWQASRPVQKEEITRHVRQHHTDIGIGF
ncbi:MAG TPA: hypothetical protein VK638_58035, partial [Edaphobacter sp.]|nr:hypothetical protein [Edaphobacter sp.]